MLWFGVRRKRLRPTSVGHLDLYSGLGTNPFDRTVSLVSQSDRNESRTKIQRFLYSQEGTSLTYSTTPPFSRCRWRLSRRQGWNHWFDPSFPFPTPLTEKSVLNVSHSDPRLVLLPFYLLIYFLSSSFRDDNLRYMDLRWWDDDWSTHKCEKLGTRGVDRNHHHTDLPPVTGDLMSTKTIFPSNDRGRRLQDLVCDVRPVHLRENCLRGN